MSITAKNEEAIVLIVEKHSFRLQIEGWLTSKAMSFVIIQTR